MLCMIFCVKEEYCIVIDFEKREKKNYIAVYVTLSPSLFSKFITIQYFFFFFHRFRGVSGQPGNPPGCATG